MNEDSIKIEIPLSTAKELAKFTETYAPLVKIVAKACFDVLYDNKIVIDDEENKSMQLVDELRERACPAGEPWTGDDPTSDHGHTDCFLHNKAADELERLTKLINEWVDVQPGRTKSDMDRRISIAYDLRKAVGR
jgi:hypothetical protein